MVKTRSGLETNQAENTWNLPPNTTGECDLCGNEEELVNQYYDHQINVNNLLRKKLEVMSQNLADRKEYARRVHSNQQKLHELEMQSLLARIRHLEEVNMRNSFSMQPAQQSNFQYQFQDVHL
eukprot:g583.t1